MEPGRSKLAGYDETTAVRNYVVDYKNCKNIFEDVTLKDKAQPKPVKIVILKAEDTPIL